ncbi:MAG: TIGR02147 family protein [Fibrobacter sp.]|nr:TIGR02147 family protein [Fibrobacter sp.]
MSNIYGYIDYIEYLQADYKKRKQKNSRYSYRAMAEKLGLNSSTVVRIMNGKRGLSKSMIPRFSSYLQLSDKENRYFSQMVVFRAARSEHTRVAAYRELLALRNGRIKTISEKQYQFYEEWYYTAIREILRISDFKGDFDKLAQTLIPAITAPQARRAVDLLIKLGMVEKLSSSYSVTSANISTGEVWESAAVHNFQCAVAQKALEALEELPREERDFSTMTMCYSSKGIQKAKEILKRTREELTRIEEADEEKDRVFQINLQLFPLSRPAKEI